MKTRAKAYGTANVIGKCVESIRISKGIKQIDFIAKLQSMGLDINPTSYSKLEGQLRQATDIELYYIAKALDTDIIELFKLFESSQL